MKSVNITGTPRTEVGKKSAKAIRTSGQVPCVLYGGKQPVHFTLDARAFKDLVYTPEVNKVSLDVDGQQFTAVLQDVQYEPVKDTILHADFLEMIEGKIVKVELPVSLVGAAAGVKAGGKLIKKLRKVKVKGVPADLPSSISVNVENLEVGGTVKVRDIDFDKVEFLNSPNTVIATVKGKRGAAAADATADAKK